MFQCNNTKLRVAPWWGVAATTLMTKKWKKDQASGESAIPSRRSSHSRARRKASSRSSRIPR